MIKIIAGGKKPTAWQLAAISDYEKRLRKPYDLNWQFLPEDKLAKFLDPWPFDKTRDYVIVCDERGENISSPAFAAKLSTAVLNSKNVIILIGGAYGFSATTRTDADFTWSFSQLVFPHSIARLIVTEQIYRATQILQNTPYHHA